MKKQIILVTILLFSSILFAQTNGFNYKALISENGNILSNATVSIRFTILEGSVNVYQETHTGTTDSNGIISVVIGQGSTADDFYALNWYLYNYNLKVEIDTGNGSGFQDFGTNEFQYVPYANFALVAGSVNFYNLTGVPANLDTDSTDDVQQINDLSDGITTGFSVFLGENAGASDDGSDNQNTGIGYMALYNTTTGSANTGVGYNTLLTNTTGEANTALGYIALLLNTTGKNNTATGYASMYNNTTGERNTANGYSTLFWNTTGSYNIAVGNYALYVNSTGHDNVAVGSESLFSNETGSNNLAMGSKSLKSNTTASDNTALGFISLENNTTGLWNTAVGSSTLNKNTTGKNNNAIGVSALYNNTTGENNTAMSVHALFNNTEGNNNTAIGNYALPENTTADNNTAVGNKALRNNTTGTANTAIGGEALLYNTTGDYNAAIGRYALEVNTTGSQNVALGSGAYFGLNNLNNTICIGYNSGNIINSDNHVEIGNVSSTWIGGQVGWSTFSDRRIKKDIKDNVVGLDFITRLRPVTYHLDIHKQTKMINRGKKGKPYAEWDSKYDIEKILMTGFIAQEVEQAASEVGYDFSGVQKADDDLGMYSVSYAQFVVPLVKATQEQQEIIENQNNTIQQLKNKNLELEQRLEKLEKLLLK